MAKSLVGLEKSNSKSVAVAVKLVPITNTCELDPLNGPRRLNEPMPSLIVRFQSRILPLPSTPSVPSVSIVPKTPPGPMLLFTSEIGPALAIPERASIKTIA